MSVNDRLFSLVLLFFFVLLLLFFFALLLLSMSWKERPYFVYLCKTHDTSHRQTRRSLGSSTGSWMLNFVIEIHRSYILRNRRNFWVKTLIKISMSYLGTGLLPRDRKYERQKPFRQNFCI